MTRWVKLVATAILVVGLGLAATWASRRLGADDPALTVTGTIEGTQVDVSTKVTGRIVELTAREGSRVERGALLVRLDPAELAAETSRAEAALRAAEGRRLDLEAGARREEIDEAEARVAKAQAQLEDLLAGSRAQEIEQARAALRTASATRQWTERDYHRTQDLYAKEFVSAQEVDRARQAYEVAVANEQGAHEKLALVEAGARRHEIEGARAELRAARERARLLRAGPRPDAVAAARAQVAEARAALDLARARLGEARLRSPLTGVVLRKNLAVGETANPGVSILTLLDPNDLWLRAYVPEADTGRIRVGQRVGIVVDAYPDREFPGTVTEIGSEAEFTPKNVQTKKERVNLVFRIRIAFANPEGVLKPGLPADARLYPVR
jgi:membrane fusion protein YbhG